MLVTLQSCEVLSLWAIFVSFCMWCVLLFFQFVVIEAKISQAKAVKILVIYDMNSSQ